MQKVKKVMAIVLATLMTASAMSGCQSSGGTSSAAPGASSSATPASSGAASQASSTPAASGQTELVFYANPAQNNDSIDTVAAFEKENPNIKVQLVELPADTTKKAQNISTILQSKDSSMDVFYIDATWPSTYAAAGWVEPLNDLYTEEEMKGFLPGPIAANTVDGKLCSVPLYIDGGILIYRKDMLDKYSFQPPKTWDEMAEQSKTIMAKEPSITAGFASAWKQYEGMVCCALEFIWDYGGDVLDESGKVILNSKETAAGLQRMRDLTYVDEITDAGILGYMWTDDRVLFNSGNTLFIRDWPSAYAAVTNPKDSTVYDKVGFAKLPEGPAGSYTTLGGWSLAVSAFSEHKQEAKAFLKYYTGAVGQKIGAINATRLPVLTSVYDDAEVLKAHPNFAELKICAANVRGRPKSAYYEELSGVLQQGFSAILANTMEVQQSIDDMVPQLEEIMSR